MHLINGDLQAEFGPTLFGTSDIARTPIEVSIEGSSTLISHLPSVLIINHQSVLNSHPTRRCQVCIRLSFAKEDRSGSVHLRTDPRLRLFRLLRGIFLRAQPHLLCQGGESSV